MSMDFETSWSNTKTTQIRTRYKKYTELIHVRLDSIHFRTKTDNNNIHLLLLYTFTEYERNAN